MEEIPFKEVTVTLQLKQWVLLLNQLESATTLRKLTLDTSNLASRSPEDLEDLAAEVKCLADISYCLVLIDQQGDLGKSRRQYLEEAFPGINKLTNGE
jgi:hypothetical protein